MLATVCRSQPLWDLFFSPHRDSSFSTCSREHDSLWLVDTSCCESRCIHQFPLWPSKLLHMQDSRPITEAAQGFADTTDLSRCISFWTRYAHSVLFLLSVVCVLTSEVQGTCLFIKIFCWPFRVSVLHNEFPGLARNRWSCMLRHITREEKKEYNFPFGTLNFSTKDYFSFLAHLYGNNVFFSSCCIIRKQCHSFRSKKM